MPKDHVLRCIKDAAVIGDLHWFCVVGTSRHIGYKIFKLTSVEIETYISKLESLFSPKVRWRYGSKSVERNIPASFREVGF